MQVQTAGRLRIKHKGEMSFARPKGSKNKSKTVEAVEMTVEQFEEKIAEVTAEYNGPHVKTTSKK